MNLWIQLNYHEKLDVYSFFSVKHSVKCPEALLFDAICASLKIKKSVLILEEEFETFPQWDPNKRFVAEDKWCWLAPRSLGFIQEVAGGKSNLTYQELNRILLDSK